MLLRWEITVVHNIQNIGCYGTGFLCRIFIPAVLEQFGQIVLEIAVVNT